MSYPIVHKTHARYKIKYAKCYYKLTIINDIFKALKFINNCDDSIIHADIKPENIFLYNDKSFHIVLGDFGLAIKTNGKLTNPYFGPIKPPHIGIILAI